MNDKVLSLLGLCRRANKLVFGYDMTVKSLKEKKTFLILLTDDVSIHTESDIRKEAEKENVKVIKTKYFKEDMDMSISKYTAVLSILDEGFSKKLESLLKDN